MLDFSNQYSNEVKILKGNEQALLPTDICYIRGIISTALSYRLPEHEMQKIKEIMEMSGWDWKNHR